MKLVKNYANVEVQFCKLPYRVLSKECPCISKLAFCNDLSISDKLVSVSMQVGYIMAYAAVALFCTLHLDML